MLWQTIDGKKKTINGTFSSHKKEKERTIVSIKLEKTFPFDQEAPVFLFEETNGILFKGQYEYSVSQNLKLIVDDKVFLKEKRSISRFPFTYSNVILEISYSHNNQEFQLKDVSEQGFSVLMSAKAASSIKAKDEIGLVSIHGVKLPQVIKAEVVHVTKSKREKSKVIVGCKFARKSKLFSLIAAEMGLY